jgi:uncharacterized protein YggE
MIVTRKFSAFAFALIAAAILFAPLPASAHDDDSPKRFISLSATGTVSTRPDKVEISTGVTSQAETAREALAKNSEAMTQVVATLKAEGLDPKDIQTLEFTIQPLREPYKEGVSPKIIGYQVTNSVHLTLHDIGKLGTILDKVVTLGANEVGAIEFGVSEPEALKDEARKAAVAEAIANAKLYAEAAGAKLGKLLTISEDSGVFVPRGGPRAAMEMKAPAPPIEAGTATVEVRITATFALE